jgi:uncharacterized protein YndB with AHSA1/START domain
VPRFELTVDIDRSPGDVFAYLVDVSNIPEWQSSARDVEAEGVVQLGTRVHERRQFLGRDVTTVLEVTAFEPPKRFDLASRGGPVPFAIEHTLEPDGDRTRLAVEVDVRLGGMMRVAAQGPLKLARREFESDFARLKAILEAGHSPRR